MAGRAGGGGGFCPKGYLTGFLLKVDQDIRYHLVEDQEPHYIFRVIIYQGWGILVKHTE